MGFPVRWLLVGFPRFYRIGEFRQSNGPQQDYGYYGQGVRGVRNGQRGGGGEYYTQAATPPLNPSSISTKNSEGQVSQNEFSPGLLDLHSHDTELLPEAYIVYGFMLLVILILVSATVCVTIVGAYCLLNTENYH